MFAFGLVGGTSPAAESGDAVPHNTSARRLGTSTAARKGRRLIKQATTHTPIDEPPRPNGIAGVSPCQHMAPASPRVAVRAREDCRERTGSQRMKQLLRTP